MEGPRRPSPGTRVLVVSTDPLGRRMPGPAIRAWHLAEILAAHCRVTLVSTVACERQHPDLATGVVAFEDLPGLAQRHDVVVCPAGVLHFWPSLADSDVPTAFDLYDPYHLENLASAGASPGGDRDAHLRAVNEGINAHLVRGDFFMCASERQRDFWIGSLTALGRVNPATYGSSPDLTGLIDLVPFGISRGAPRKAGGHLRARFPAIAPGDKVFLWAGGIYDWFDPLTLIEACARVAARRPGVHLVFLGAGHPNPAIPPMPVAVEARRLARTLDPGGTTVIFNDEWVPYDERDLWLTDADVGVSTHLDHAETRYSFRTRVLDYLWAGLPTVLSAGDVLSEALGRAGVALSVPGGDAHVLAAALESALEMHPGDEQFASVREHLYWDRVAEPLVRFCTDPHRAADAPRRPPTEADGRHQPPATIPQPSPSEVRGPGSGRARRRWRSPWRGLR